MHKCNVGFEKSLRINIVYLQGVPNISDVEEEQGEFASQDEYWRIEDEDFEQDEDGCDSDQTSVPSNAGIKQF